MPTWWDSIPTVASITWWLRWAGVFVTAIGAICTGLSLFSGKRLENLKDARDNLVAQQALENENHLKSLLKESEARQRQRSLTSEQRACLVAALEKIPSKIPIRMTVLAGDNEAIVFASELQSILEDGGLVVPTGVWHAPFSPVPKGVLVAVADPEHVTAFAHDLLMALKGCGIQAGPGFEHTLTIGEVKVIIGAKE